MRFIDNLGLSIQFNNCFANATLTRKTFQNRHGEKVLVTIIALCVLKIKKNQSLIVVHEGTVSGC